MDGKIENFSDFKLQIGNYFATLKLQIVLLVFFAALAGIFLAPSKIYPLLALVAFLCIMLGSGAAGAINMWYERDISALIERMQKRPITAKNILPQSGLEFAFIAAFISVLVMSLAINLMAGFLLLIAILFYVFIYTIWLKKITPYNIVVAGAAVACTPIIGWAAVTGDISWESFSLFMIVFAWIPPHFWAMALYKNDDCTSANIPILPVVACSEETRKQIFIYALVLFLCSIFPLSMDMFGLIYGVASIALGVRFMQLTHELYIEYSEELAQKIFKYSQLYIALLFSFMIIDRLIFNAIS